MPACFLLQDLRSLEAGHDKGFVFTQPLEEVADVLPYRTLVVQVRRPYLSSMAGTNVLVVQHAPFLDEAAFQTLGSPFDLNASDNVVQVLTNPLRHIRWRVSLGATGSKTIRFLVEVVARET